MMEIALSTATQRRPFLPFLPLTVSQRRRRSVDNAAPTSCDRRRHVEPGPNAGGARLLVWPTMDDFDKKHYNNAADNTNFSYFFSGFRRVDVIRYACP
jgi:hypothetical protein